MNLGKSLIQRPIRKDLRERGKEGPDNRYTRRQNTARLHTVFFSVFKTFTWIEGQKTNYSSRHLKRQTETVNPFQTRGGGKGF